MAEKAVALSAAVFSYILRRDVMTTNPVKFRSWPIGAAVTQHKTQIMRQLQRPFEGNRFTGTNSGAKTTIPDRLNPIKTMKFPSMNLTST